MVYACDVSRGAAVQLRTDVDGRSQKKEFSRDIQKRSDPTILLTSAGDITVSVSMKGPSALDKL